MGHQTLVKGGSYDDGVLGALADEPMALQHFGRAGRAHDHRKDGGMDVDAVLHGQLFTGAIGGKNMNDN